MAQSKSLRLFAYISNKHDLIHMMIKSLENLQFEGLSNSGIEKLTFTCNILIVLEDFDVLFVINWNGKYKKAMEISYEWRYSLPLLANQWTKRMSLGY